MKNLVILPLLVLLNCCYAQNRHSNIPLETPQTDTTILIHLGQGSSSNTFIPIVTHKNEWIIDYIFPSFPLEVRRYTFTSDSFFLGNRHYRKLIYNQSMTGGVWKSTDDYFREENSKVYKLGGFSGQTERLIYDMAFAVGDTMVPNQDIGQMNRQITEVGIVQLLDNLPRKRALLSSTVCGGHTTWIEGMGDLERLFWTETFCSLIDLDGAISRIRCFSTDQKLLYLRPDLSGCYISSTHETTNENVLIYPNPTQSDLFISLQNNQEIEFIQVFNQLGQLMNHFPIVHFANANSIDVSPLTNGCYYGEMIFKNAPPILFRFVVNE